MVKQIFKDESGTYELDTETGDVVEVVETVPKGNENESELPSELNDSTEVSSNIIENDTVYANAKASDTLHGFWEDQFLLPYRKDRKQVWYLLDKCINEYHSQLSHIKNYKELSVSDRIKKYRYSISRFQTGPKYIYSVLTQEGDFKIKEIGRTFSTPISNVIRLVVFKMLDEDKVQHEDMEMYNQMVNEYNRILGQMDYFAETLEMGGEPKIPLVSSMKMKN